RATRSQRTTTPRTSTSVWGTVSLRNLLGKGQFLLRFSKCVNRLAILRVHARRDAPFAHRFIEFAAGISDEARFIVNLSRLRIVEPLQFRFNHREIRLRGGIGRV